MAEDFILGTDDGKQCWIVSITSRRIQDRLEYSIKVQCICRQNLLGCCSWSIRQPSLLYSDSNLERATSFLVALTGFKLRPTSNCNLLTGSSQTIIRWTGFAAVLPGWHGHSRHSAFVDCRRNTWLDHVQRPCCELIVSAYSMLQLTPCV